MKKIISVFFVVGCLVSGCTSATQPFAVEAMRRHLDQEQTIIYDLTRKGEQLSLDKASAEMLIAVKGGDTEKANKILETVTNDMRLFGWYKVQAERSRAMARVSQTFIWSQKGILNILSDEWSAAKKASDAKLNSNGSFESSTAQLSNESIDASLETAIGK